MRVVMEPLLGDIPLIGALSVFFLKKPVSTLTFGSLWNAFRSCCFLYVSWSDFYINESQNALFSLRLDLHCKKGEHQAFYMKTHAHANFELITCRVLAYEHQLLSLRSYWFSLPDGGPAGTVHACHLPQRFSLQSSWRQPNSSPPLSVHSFSLTAAFLPVLQHGPSSRFSLWWWHSEEKYLLS